VIEEKTLGAEDANLNELRKTRDELTAQRDALRVSKKKSLQTKYLGQFNVFWELFKILQESFLRTVNLIEISHTEKVLFFLKNINLVIVI